MYDSLYSMQVFQGDSGGAVMSDLGTGFDVFAGVISRSDSDRCDQVDNIKSFLLFLLFFHRKSSMMCTLGLFIISLGLEVQYVHWEGRTHVMTLTNFKRKTLKVIVSNEAFISITSQHVLCCLRPIPPFAIQADPPSRVPTAMMNHTGLKIHPLKFIAAVSSVILMNMNAGKHLNHLESGLQKTQQALARQQNVAKKVGIKDGHMLLTGQRYALPLLSQIGEIKSRPM